MMSPTNATTTTHGDTVKTLFASFFLMLANATDRELARQVQYLKAENRLLRDRLPRRINVTAQERRCRRSLRRAFGWFAQALLPRRLRREPSAKWSTQLDDGRGSR